MSGERTPPVRGEPVQSPWFVFSGDSMWVAVINAIFTGDLKWLDMNEASAKYFAEWLAFTSPEIDLSGGLIDAARVRYRGEYDGLSPAAFDESTYEQAVRLGQASSQLASLAQEVLSRASATQTTKMSMIITGYVTIIQVIVSALIAAFTGGAGGFLGAAAIAAARTSIGARLASLFSLLGRAVPRMVLTAGRPISATFGAMKALPRFAGLSVRGSTWGQQVIRQAADEFLEEFVVVTVGTWLWQALRGDARLINPTYGLIAAVGGVLGGALGVPVGAAIHRLARWSRVPGVLAAGVRGMLRLRDAPNLALPPGIGGLRKWLADAVEMMIPAALTNAIVSPMTSVLAQALVTGRVSFAEFWSSVLGSGLAGAGRSGTHGLLDLTCAGHATADLAINGTRPHEAELVQVLNRSMANIRVNPFALRILEATHGLPDPIASQYAPEYFAGRHPEAYGADAVPDPAGEPAPTATPPTVPLDRMAAIAPEAAEVLAHAAAADVHWAEATLTGGVESALGRLDRLAEKVSAVAGDIAWGNGSTAESTVEAVDRIVADAHALIAAADLPGMSDDTPASHHETANGDVDSLASARIRAAVSHLRTAEFDIINRLSTITDMTTMVARSESQATLMVAERDYVRGVVAADGMLSVLDGASYVHQMASRHASESTGAATEASTRLAREIRQDWLSAEADAANDRLREAQSREAAGGDPAGTVQRVGHNDGAAAVAAAVQARARTLATAEPAVDSTIDSVTSNSPGNSTGSANPIYQALAPETTDDVRQFSPAETDPVTAEHVLLRQRLRELRGAAELMAIRAETEAERSHLEADQLAARAAEARLEHEATRAEVRRANAEMVAALRDYIAADAAVPKSRGPRLLSGKENSAHSREAAVRRRRLAEARYTEAEIRGERLSESAAESYRRIGELAMIADAKRVVAQNRSAEHNRAKWAASELNRQLVDLDRRPRHAAERGATSAPTVKTPGSQVPSEQGVGAQKNVTPELVAEQTRLRRAVAEAELVVARAQAFVVNLRTAARSTDVSTERAAYDRALTAAVDRAAARADEARRIADEHAARFGVGISAAMARDSRIDDGIGARVYRLLYERWEAAGASLADPLADALELFAPQLDGTFRSQSERTSAELTTAITRRIGMPIDAYERLSATEQAELHHTRTWGATNSWSAEVGVRPEIDDSGVRRQLAADRTHRAAEDIKAKRNAERARSRGLRAKFGSSRGAPVADAESGRSVGTSDREANERAAIQSGEDVPDGMVSYGWRLANNAAMRIGASLISGAIFAWASWGVDTGVVLSQIVKVVAATGFVLALPLGDTVLSALAARRQKKAELVDAASTANGSENEENKSGIADHRVRRAAVEAVGRLDERHAHERGIEQAAADHGASEGHARPDFEDSVSAFDILADQYERALTGARLVRAHEARLADEAARVEAQAAGKHDADIKARRARLGELRRKFAGLASAHEQEVDSLRTRLDASTIRIDLPAATPAFAGIRGYSPAVDNGGPAADPGATFLDGTLSFLPGSVAAVVSAWATTVAVGAPMTAIVPWTYLVASAPLVALGMKLGHRTGVANRLRFTEATKTAAEEMTQREISAARDRIARSDAEAKMLGDRYLNLVTKAKMMADGILDSARDESASVSETASGADFVAYDGSDEPVPAASLGGSIAEKGMFMGGSSLVELGVLAVFGSPDGVAITPELFATALVATTGVAGSFGATERVLNVKVANQRAGLRESHPDGYLKKPEQVMVTKTLNRLADRLAEENRRTETYLAEFSEYLDTAEQLLVAKQSVAGAHGVRDGVAGRALAERIERFEGSARTLARRFGEMKSAIGVTVVPKDPDSTEAVVASEPYDVASTKMTVDEEIAATDPGFARKVAAIAVAPWTGTAGFAVGAAVLGQPLNVIVAPLSAALGNTVGAIPLAVVRAPKPDDDGVRRTFHQHEARENIRRLRALEQQESDALYRSVEAEFTRLGSSEDDISAAMDLLRARRYRHGADVLTDLHLRVAERLLDSD